MSRRSKRGVFYASLTVTWVIVYDSLHGGAVWLHLQMLFS